MADFINATTLAIAQSVNTPDYSTPPWYSPVDLSQVVAVPGKYWKWDAVNLRPVEMTVGEKATVDAAEAVSANLGVQGKFILKRADETRSATTTLADDAELKFAVAANKNYLFWFRVFFDTGATEDFKIALNGPASPVGVRFYRFAVVPGATALSGVGVSTAWGGALSLTGTGTTGGYCEGFGVVRNGATAGNVAFQWAQNTSGATSSIVRAGSLLQYAELR